MNAHAERYACCLLLLAACAKDDGGDRTRSEFCQAWGAAACSGEVVSVCQAADVEACRSSQEDACVTRVPANFSDAMGKACIDAVKVAYADADLKGDELALVLSLAGPCAKIFRGEKHVGDACVNDRDCDASTGFACVLKSDKPKGTCQKPELTQAGRDCSAAQKACVVGFFCNGDNCIEAKGAGDACAFDAECASSGFCNDDKKCEARRKVGTACTADLQCTAGVCYEFEGKKTCTDRIVLARSEPLCEELR